MLCTKKKELNQIADWVEVANIAKSLGFSWRGDWKLFPDYPHLEMTSGLSTAQLRADSRPRLVSKVSNTTTHGVYNPAPKPATKSVAKNPESIVGYLKSNEEDSSFKTRKKIDELHTIKNYTGTAVQNEQLIKSVKKNRIYPKIYPLPDATYWVEILGLKVKE